MSLQSGAVRVALLTESNERLPASVATDVQDAFERVGRNTGNIAFHQVLEHHLDDELGFVSWFDEPGEIRERFDVLLIPEASVLASGKDFGRKADVVVAVDLPVVVTGIGFQDDRWGRSPRPPEGTLRYMRALADRTAMLGVRGPRSQSILRRAGIANTLVTGCPSVFWHRDRLLGRRIEQRLQAAGGPPLRPAVAVGPSKRQLRRVHRRLFDWVVRRDGAWIAQSGDLLARALRHEAVSAPHGRGGSGPPVALRAFVEAEDWMTFLEGYDVSVNPRIHGTILALQAGVPGFCITHDGRTAELAETCGVPTLAPRQFFGRDPERLVAERGFDGVRFDEARKHLAGAYARLLGEAGLHPVSWLVDIGDG